MINPYKAKLELINLVQAVPEKELVTAKKLIESLISHSIDPLTLALITAPIDDEPWTREDEEDLKEARKDILEGNTVPWEQVKKELGL